MPPQVVVDPLQPGARYEHLADRQRVSGSPEPARDAHRRALRRGLHHGQDDLALGEDREAGLAAGLLGQLADHRAQDPRDLTVALALVEQGDGGPEPVAPVVGELLEVALLEQDVEDVVAGRQARSQVPSQSLGARAGAVAAHRVDDPERPPRARVRRPAAPTLGHAHGLLVRGGEAFVASVRRALQGPSPRSAGAPSARRPEGRWCQCARLGDRRGRRAGSPRRGPNRLGARVEVGYRASESGCSSSSRTRARKRAASAP